LFDATAALTAGPLVLGALVLSLIAAGWDLASRRIPNLLTVTGMAVGLAGHVVLEREAGLAWSLAGLLVGLGLLLLPCIVGGMGGGDLKLMGALGALVGPASVFEIALVSAVAGGVLALGVALHRKVVRAAFRQAFAALGLQTGPATAPHFSAPPARGALGTIPYGVAIGAGTWFCLLGHGPF
jgi:prepilin peptidase CpaA